MSSQTLLWIQGFELLVVGMCLVFTFLLLLVFTTKCMSWLVGREEEPVTTSLTNKKKAAISAAVHQFHTERQQNKE